MSKLRLRFTEDIRKTIYRFAVEIETDQYPELNGMSEEEMMEYIEEHVWDMEAPEEHNKYCSTLGEALSEQDIDWEDEDDTSPEISFE